MMQPNTALFAALLDEFKEVRDREIHGQGRARYGVWVPAIGLWAGENNHWVPREHAKQFDFVITAETFATTELGLDTKAFNVGVL